MKVTANYCVAGHRFGVSAEEQDLKRMENYEPFLDISATSGAPAAFNLTISREPLPVYTEKIRQTDGEQTIIYGVTADGSPLFEFQWCGATAGCLVCSDDYREGILIPMGTFSKFAIDNALMIMYALATAGAYTLLFHAAVVSYQGGGYMFLGPSGTGKSTHARLWTHHIAGTELVNDDNPVVRIADDGLAMVYGSPWSGKTPCYRNVGCPLKGIVQLRQAPYNKILSLTGLHAYAAIMAAISGIRWDRRIADGLHLTESRLVESVAVWRLECLPDTEAAQVCQSAIAHS